MKEWPVSVDPTDQNDPHSGDALASRAEKLRKIEALGLDPWGQRFDGHFAIAEILAKPCLSFDENPTEKVRAAGRIVLRRDMGKVHFLQLRDLTGTAQVMIGQKQVGEQGWQLAQLLDLGDLIGVDGVFGKTRKGEPTIRAEGLTFLTKSLEPHPEKFHGMADEEYRLRHRYLDLVYTPETLERTKQRITIVRTMRNYLDNRGFMEVETPTLHSIAGGAAARPFVTHHNALDFQLYLRIALELHLKRLLVGGLERVYEIGRVFRNEGISRKHNPEFTMLELYQAYGDYHSMMDLTEGLIVACVDAIGGGRVRPWGDKSVDFSPPWQRAKYGELFREHVGASMDDRAAVFAAADNLHLPTQGKEHDVLVHDLFEHCVEDKLSGPVFVYDYPAALCPLTKRQRGNPNVAERFELYVHGMELANAYTELNDPITQEATFRRQLSGLKEEDSMAKMDADFIRAQRHGMPPAGGLGIGIDRLVMLLTNTPTIRDVILFPLLRPEKTC
jgi:lysyl-tRNA synthetase, class II